MPLAVSRLIVGGTAIDGVAAVVGDGLLEDDRIDGLHAVERDDDGRTGLGAVVLLVADAMREPRLGAVLAVGRVAQRLAVVGTDLLFNRDRTEVRCRLGSGTVDLVDLDLVDGEPAGALVVGGRDNADAEDVCLPQILEVNNLLAVVVERLALDVNPLATVVGLLEDLQLARAQRIVEVAAVIGDREAIEVERVGLLDAEERALGDGRRVLVAQTGVGLAVEQHIGLGRGAVGAARHELREVRIGVGGQLGTLGDIGVERVDRGHDVRLADAGVLGVVDVEIAVVVGIVKLRGALGVLGDQRGRVARQVGLDGLELEKGSLGLLLHRVDPGADLLEHILVASGRAVGCSDLLQLGEDRGHAIHIACGDRARGELGAEVGQRILDIGRLAVLPGRAAAVHAERMAGEGLERIGAGGCDRRVVVHVREGIVPRGVGVLGGRPQVPREVGVHEDRLLGRLGLLHGVEHDALDLARLEVGAQEVVVAAHVQGVLIVIGAGPVDPHEGCDAGVVLERGGKLAVDLAPDAAAGVDDLDGIGKVLIPCLALAVVGHGAEDDRVLEAGVLERTVLVGGPLLLADPFRHVFAQLDVQVGSLVGRIVGQDGDLADTVVHDLRELRLQNLYGRIVVRVGDGVAHEGVQRVDEAALRLVAGLCQRVDLLGELFLGVEGAPLSIVLGVVLRSVHVGVQLVVAAPRHEVHAVLGAPRVAVVALDEAARDDVRVIAHGEGAKLRALGLLQDLVQRGEAVVRRIGAGAQDDHAVGRVAGCGQRREHVGIGLVEQTLGDGEDTGLHELLDHRVDDAAGALHAHQDVGGARSAELVGPLRLHPLEGEDLVEAGRGVRIDAVLEHDVRFAAKRLRARGVRGPMRGRVNLVSILCCPSGRGGTEGRHAAQG